MKDTAKTIETAVLVCDIVSSTELYERLGDVEARQRVGACLERLTDAIATHDGQVVKSMGDGLLCSFEAAEKAFWSAVGMGSRARTNELEIRVGLHFGKVVVDGGDIFGDAVNTASRIVNLAKPQEILFSTDAAEYLPTVMGPIVRAVPPIEVKGKKKPLALHSIQFSELEAFASGDDFDVEAARTIVMSGRPVTSTGQASLSLKYEGNTLRLGPDAQLSIGRDPECGLRVSSSFVSRQHARIYHQQGKFVLEDTSSNGTFLVPQWQSKIQLLRETAILHGFGLIYLGADPDHTASEPIRFQSADQAQA